MAKVHGAIYSPPSEGLPPVAIILYENEVVGCRAVPSVAAGDVFLAKMMQEFSGMVGHKAPMPKKSNKTLP
jgi:hypothetical protein